MIIQNEEKYRKLNLLYANMAFAYLDHNENDMKFYCNDFLANHSEYKDIAIQNIICVFRQNNVSILRLESIDQINGESLRFNTFGYLQTIWYILYQNKHTPFSVNALATIYSPKKTHHPNDILYRYNLDKNHQTGIHFSLYENKRELTVGDLLSVINYSMSILDTFQPSQKTQEIQDVSIILKNLDLALNNKKSDSPVNKSLHLVNSILSSTITKSLDKEKDKRNVSQMSLLVDLAIDFFVSS